jgi:hypothetical protein
MRRIFVKSMQGLMQPMARRRPRAKLGAAALLVLGACGREPGLAAPPPDSADLSARCDAALEEARPASLRKLAWSYQPRRRIGDENTHPLGRIVGAAWTPENDRLFVVDGINGRVSVYGASGEFLRSFGRTGGGPGEFEELSGMHGMRAVYNQAAVLAPGFVGIQDLGLLHLFDLSGRFVHRIPTNGAQQGPFAVRHVAAFSDSSFLIAENGAMWMEAPDPAVRTRIRLLVATVRAGALDTLEYGYIRSHLARLPASGGVPRSDPYSSDYRRTWDASAPGLLSVASLEHHGVCFFGAAGELLAAHRVRAPEIPVDGAEKRRVVEVARAGAKSGPMAGWDWEKAYRAWPRTAPFYVDVVLAPDSTVWMERVIPGGGREIDLYHPRRGYLGSMPPLGSRLPVTFASRCGFAVQEEAAGDPGGTDFYGLVEWCPTPIGGDG